MYNFKETSVKRWKQVTSAPTLFYCFGNYYLSACYRCRYFEAYLQSEFSPFGLSVLFLDGLGKGIHRWFWGDSSPVLKSLKFLWIPLSLLRLFIFSQISNKYFSRVYSKFVLSLVRPLLTQNVEWVEIPTDGTNSKILATFISFPFHGAGMRTCFVHGHRLFTFSLWRTA